MAMEIQRGRWKYREGGTRMSHGNRESIINELTRFVYSTIVVLNLNLILTSPFVKVVFSTNKDRLGFLLTEILIAL